MKHNTKKMSKERKILLNYLLKEYKQSLRQKSDDQLANDIQSYFRMQKQLQDKRSLIQDQINQIQAMDKSLATRFKKIQTYMESNEISEKKVNDWVARLNTVAKYKRITPDYKQMWSEALKKVNEATRRVLEQIKIANEQTKRAATKIELELVEENVFDVIKSLFTKFVRLFKAFDNYKRVSDSLPRIK